MLEVTQICFGDQKMIYVSVVSHIFIYTRVKQVIQAKEVDDCVIVPMSLPF